MLKKLSIRNFAIIDELTMDFSPQLNIITGETGAGKSILVGALSLLLGQKVDHKALFKQDQKCVIEGLFTLPQDSLKDIFLDLDIDYEEEAILRREISMEGKSRAFINDSPVSQAVLQEIGNHLVDIHSQHETLDINLESFQVRFLDAVAAQSADFIRFKGLLSEYKKKEKRISSLKEVQQKSASEIDFISFQLEELAKASIKDAEEQVTLEAELLALSHAEEIRRALYQCSGNLDSDEHSVIQNLRLSLGALQSIERFFPSISPYLERVRSCQIEIRDIHAEIESLLESVPLDAARMETIQERLHLLYSLEQKHRVSDLPQLMQIEKDLFDKLEGMQLGDDQIDQLEKEYALLRVTLEKLATVLSNGRKKVIPMVENEIRNSLGELGIKEGNFRVQMESTKNVEQVSFSPYGFDRIRFLFSANKGFAPSDLSKVASGGELSRLVLAIKTLSSKHITMPTLLFDEIDTGVSGEVALKVGRVMENLSTHNQVIAITHLPQIASRQGKHFFVFKDIQKGITKTQMRELDIESRSLEIAKMLSGNNPSEFALKNAKELLASE